MGNLCCNQGDNDAFSRAGPDKLTDDDLQAMDKDLLRYQYFRHKMILNLEGVKLSESTKSNAFAVLFKIGIDG